MDFQSELTELFKNGCEEVYFRDSKEDNGITERFKEDDKVICYIVCEDRPNENDEINLDYYELGGGSEKFNDILEKYNMCQEWEDCSVASVYKD